MPRKRELIDTGTDKRYVRRDDQGRFDEVTDVGRSLSQDVRKKAKKTVEAGQGDKGDQKRTANRSPTPKTHPQDQQPGRH
jgi:hypothetical protein